MRNLEGHYFGISTDHKVSDLWILDHLEAIFKKFSGAPPLTPAALTLLAHAATVVAVASLPFLGKK